MSDVDARGVVRPPPSADSNPPTHDAALTELRVRMTLMLGRTQLLLRHLESGLPLDPDAAVRGLTEIEQHLWAMEGALRANESAFRVVVEEAVDYAILTTGPDGRIDGWYPGAESVFGWTEAEILGQPLDVTFTLEDRAAGVPAKEFAEARDTGRAADVRWHLRKDGTRVFIEGVARARYRGVDTFHGVLKIGQNVTERRRAGQLRRESEERARQDLERRVFEATAELRALSRRLLLVQEQERQRLALELHDEVGQVLTSLGLQLGTSQRLEGALLAEARRTVATLTEQVRELSMDLRPALLDQLGVLPTIVEQLARYQRQTGILVELRHEGVAKRRFPPEIEIAAYRIVQESLTNVARHSGSVQTRVQLFADPDVLTIVVSDRGRGFDPERTTLSSGLAGMRERAELVGGSLTVDSVPGAGATITAELPVADRGAAAKS